MAARAEQWRVHQREAHPMFQALIGTALILQVVCRWKEFVYIRRSCAAGVHSFKTIHCRLLQTSMLSWNKCSVKETGARNPQESGLTSGLFWLAGSLGLDLIGLLSLLPTP